MKIILIRQADNGSALPNDDRRPNGGAYRFYTGVNPSGLATTEALFDLSAPPTQTPLLDELPAAEKGLRGKLNARREAGRRAGEFLDLLEKEERDSVVICGGQSMSALKTALRARGYLLEGGSLIPRPLERVRATKRSLHCGGCAHNCLLSEAKCEKGQNKARGIL